MEITKRKISLISTRERRRQLSEIMEHFPPVFGDFDGIKDEEFQPLSTQVAGHQYAEGKEYSIGMLRCKEGRVLKPVIKIDMGYREIRFYEQLQNTKDSSLLMMREHCVEFYGTRMIKVHGRNTEFMILENMTEHMVEPCIIDIKIGKITWDPLATQEKIEKEKAKYADCKRDVGFCIPGFHVYKISTGRLHKYNKEYGKKLNGETVKDALRIFFNANTNNMVNRELLVKILSDLWKIQKWAKEQKSVRLYSSSLLIAYDCKKLKKIIEEAKLQPSASKKPIRKISFNLPETCSKDSTGHFSGQLGDSGPILKLNTPSSTIQHSFTCPRFPVRENTGLRKLTRSFSFHHNYNDFISKMKIDYATTLKELVKEDSEREKPWFSVKIIDFAHTFPAGEPSPDVNYIEGIDNLIQILESFLDTAE